jgi:hypothetical protein
MHAFQRRTGHQRAAPRDREQSRAFYNKERPESFSAAEARIPHGFDQARWPAQFAFHGGRGKELLKHALDLLGGGIETLKKHVLAATHCCLIGFAPSTINPISLYNEPGTAGGRPVPWGLIVNECPIKPLEDYLWPTIC